MTTSEIIRMSKVLLRCKPKCNGVLVGWHGIINIDEKTAVSYFNCPDCGKKFMVETKYDPELDDMILVSSTEVRR